MCPAAVRIKANDESKDIEQALSKLEDAACRGFDAYIKPLEIKNKVSTLALTPPDPCAHTKLLRVCSGSRQKTPLWLSARSWRT